MTTEQQASNRPRAKAAFWFISMVVIAVTSGLLFEVSRYEGTWPVSPADSDHPIANTFGELVQFKVRDQNGTIWPSLKQHEGVDILAIPFGDPYASDVIVTAEGTIKTLDVEPNDNYNEVVILTTDGANEYTYIHLEHPSPANLVAAHNNGFTVYPQDVVGTIRHAFPCGYDHLHYGVAKIVGSSQKAINPLEKIRPKPDLLPPVILDVFLARHDPPRWSTLDPAGNRTVVSGGVDIVAEVADRDDAGSAALAARNVGLYDVKWRACASANPNCGWNDTHRYDEMYSSPSPRPSELFSFSYPWVTTAEEWSDLTASTLPEGCCPASGSTFMVLRKSAGKPSWNTQELVNGNPIYPDGNYVLSVKALDYANQVDTYSVNVCVANAGPASCP